MAKNLFNPVMGSEERIKELGSSAGSVYFTTDTRKIYLDINDNKLPMGGNVALFYGKMKPPVVADDEKEFEFKMSDILGEKEGVENTLIPNINDLILNSDGCFYKVQRVEGESDEEIILHTEKLTIAGSGGGGGGSSDSPEEDGSLASFKVGAFEVANKAILQGGSCPVRFVIKATNDVGEYITGDVGQYILYINNKPVDQGTVYGIPSGEQSDSLSSFDPKYINVIDIAPFLPTAKNITPILEIYDSEGVKRAGRKLPAISVSAMELTWDYDNKTLNKWTATEDSMKLEWSVSGEGLEKTTYITIGDNDYPIEIGKGTKTKFEYELKFKDHNLSHGAHTIKMWAEAKVGLENIPTKPTYRNIIVAEEGDTTTIISVCLFNKELMQYNTVSIPVYIYNANNSAGTQVVNLVENGALKAQWTGVKNLGEQEEKSLWNYTPTIAGDAIILVVQSGGQEYTTTVAVKSIGVDLNEKSGYAFKFKANEFSSNTNVREWQSGTATLEFSDKFDWINGGLKSEEDGQGGYRQYFAIKAGSTMTIKYPLWKRNAPASGKHFKFIFKAANCRDYDAQVLACKSDKKIVHIDKIQEHLLLSEAVTTLTYSKEIMLDRAEGVIKLKNPVSGTLDINNKETRVVFDKAYVEFEDGIYQCEFRQINPEEDPDAVYAVWYKTSIQDSFNGLLIRAQDATVKTENVTLDTLFCEDSYTELEVEVTKDVENKRYIKLWLDGVPCGFSAYSTSDRFVLENEMITIGSPDCDVYVYLAKLYESELNIDEHMANFYADAPNAEEMVRRFRRNDIMSDDFDGEIDMYKLAEANPEILVHHYIVPKMPTTKKTEIAGCNYEQYQGSKEMKYYANNVMIKVQGTSSEKYVAAAANIDTDFNYTSSPDYPPTGWIDAKTKTPMPDGWSMDGGTAIPVNFTCTKVNVASSEHVNNALNQEWYNMFQPYKSVLKFKKPGARDTMQFTTGVMFVTDKNPEWNDSKIKNCVFSDTFVNGTRYTDLGENKFPKMYSIAQMGNSKENTDVFHDKTNPLECCVEVADNQTPQQWMTSDVYNKADIGEAQKYFEFRYPKKSKNASQEMIDGWNRFVSWMAHSNPQEKYKKFENILTADAYKDISTNKKTFAKIDTYVMNAEETEYIKVDAFNPAYTTYYTLTDNLYGATNLKLNLPEEQRTFGAKTFTGFRAENQKKDNGDLWQESYTPLIQGCVVDTYAGTYTHDTKEYRMAKMLAECEDYMIMDSILYHYLFIERHCMIDNVAKNTFWSTEDCQHWGLMKDYDNDTADGNDNQGYLTRTYGMEPDDDLNPTKKVFNAHQSVWFNFCHGLDVARKWMYNKLELSTVTKNDKVFNVWDPEPYLEQAEKMQKLIPERCWIEDYYRKYFRPREVYQDPMFDEMLQGGQKKLQRKQYETYQNLYMSSKYEGAKLQEDYLVFRPDGDDLGGVRIPVEVYSDCYIYSSVGGQVAKSRAKRNETHYLTCPVDHLGDATMYLFPGSNFTKMGSFESAQQLGNFIPNQMSFNGAKRLRELIYATSDAPTKNFGLIDGLGFGGNTLLEKLYISNLINYEGPLDLSGCPNLVEVNASNSMFTECKFADGAPIKSIVLERPTTLTLSNLSELETLEINNYHVLKTVNLHGIDTKIKNLSKNILSKAIENAADPDIENGYIQFHVTDAIWSIDSANEMENTTEIKLLNTMLNPSYTRPVFGSDNSTRLPYSSAFVGKLTISKAAYDGSNPLAIYNKYVTDTAFGNVDMIFESNNATLYDVIIYDGDNVPHWKKKAVKNAYVNSDFLSTGPNGAFNSADLYKSPTAEFDYAFTNTWIVKDDSGAEIKTVTGVSPSGILIDRNLHIYPQFTQTRRSYWISIKQYNPLTEQTTELLHQQFEYGTGLNTILTANGDKIIPYIEDPSNKLGLYDGYDFKGFSLVSGSTILISENSYAVRGEDTLWAVFEFTKSINSIVHPEWFEVAKITFNGENADPYAEPDSAYKIQGVYLKPASYALGGKITIPSTYEYNGTNYPVIGLTKFSDSGKRVNVSHVFVQSDENNSLYVIDDGCFRDQSTLKYFDFTNSLIRYIGANAFRSCSNLYLTTLGEVLYGIGGTAFNSAIDDSITEFTIPGSVMYLATNAFSNHLPNVPGLILNIGTEENKSNLLLAKRGDNGPSAISADALKQNNKYETINFWTNQYSAPNEKIGGSTNQSVADWFANGTLKAGGSLFVNGINNK